MRRGTENRARIVEALLALVSEGLLQPTAEQVAARAGVGTRTVFRHFDDIESLYVELNERVRRDVEPLMTGSPTDGDLASRIRATIGVRARIYEKIAPFRRSGALSRHRSEYLRGQLQQMNQQLREDLVRSLGAELETAPDVLEVCDLITSFEAWERLRVHQRLGAERATAVLEAAVLRLLGGR